MLAVLLPVPSVKETPSILEVDSYHLLVGLVPSIPALYQEDTAISTAHNHLHILHLLTMGHMLQVLLALHECAVIGGGDEGDEAQAAAMLYSTVSQHTDGLRTGVSGSTVAEGVKRGVMPFLRCAALFFNCLTGVTPPEGLSSITESSESELSLLCSYLALPCNLFQLFQDNRDFITPLIKRRGNPLHLCPERYRKLLLMWQQHCILEEIARSLEVLNVMFAFEWQML